MASPSQHPLVSKIKKPLSILLLLAHFSAQGAELHLLVPMQKDFSKNRCGELTELFIKELRNILADTVLNLDLKLQDDKKNTSFFLGCNITNAEENITLKSANQNAISEFRFRYSKRAQGFEALDWLAFQRHQSQKEVVSPPSPVSLAPQTTAQSTIDTNSDFTPQEESQAFYKKWWFWTALGIVATGITAYTVHNSLQSNTMKIEIH